MYAFVFVVESVVGAALVGARDVAFRLVLVKVYLALICVYVFVVVVKFTAFAGAASFLRVFVYFFIVHTFSLWVLAGQA